MNELLFLVFVPFRNVQDHVVQATANRRLSSTRARRFLPEGLERSEEDTFRNCCSGTLSGAAADAVQYDHVGVELFPSGRRHAIRNTKA